MSKDWVTTQEAASQLNCSATHLRRLLKDGIFKHGIHYRNIGRQCAMRPTYRWNILLCSEVLNTQSFKRKVYRQKP